MFVALAENARIPVDNPATHLELTMVHEAMVLEYSGRHLAMIEFAAALKLLLYFSLIACIFMPFGMATADNGMDALAIGSSAISPSSLVGGSCSRCSRPPSQRCACSGIRISSAARCCWGCWPCFCCSCRGASDEQTLAFDVAHMLAGAWCW